jgi:hypothetical protein
MKKYLAAAFVIAAATLGTAGAQSMSTTINGSRPQPKQQQRQAPEPSRGKAVGAFPRVANNPMQLLNPRAPQQYYGRVEDTVVEGDPVMPPHNRGESVNRYAGVVLFGFVW